MLLLLARWRIPLSYKEILRNNNFVLLFLGKVISMTGSLVYSIVSILYIYQISQSGWSVGKLEIFSYLPAIILGMLGGAFADIYNRKLILVYTDLTLGFLFVLLSQFATVNAVYIVTFFIGFVTSFSGPALQSILPQVVEKRLILKVNSIFEVALQAMRVLIPALGGFLFTWIGFKNVCIVNAVSYFCCAFFVLKMKGDFRVSEVKSKKELGLKFKELYHYLIINRPCLFLILILSLHFLGTGAWVALIAVFLKKTLFAADSTFGIVMSIIAVGSLVGGFIAPLLEKKLPQPRPIQLSLFLFSIAMLTMITLKSLAVTYAMFVLIGIGNAYFSIGLNSYFQQNLESSILGRMFGAVNTVAMLINVISMGIGGLLSDRIGIENVYIGGAILVSLAAILSLVLLKPKNIQQEILSNA